MVKSFLKKIAGDQGGLKIILMRDLVDLIQKIDGLTLSPEVKDEKNTRNNYGVRFGGCIDSDGTRSETRERGSDRPWQRCKVGDGANPSGEV